MDVNVTKGGETETDSEQPKSQGPVRSGLTARILRREPPGQDAGDRG